MKIWNSYRTVLVATTVCRHVVCLASAVKCQTASASRIGIRIVRVPVLAAAARNNHSIITPAYEYRTDASLYGTKKGAQEDTVTSFRTVRVDNETFLLEKRN